MKTGMNDDDARLKKPASKNKVVYYPIICLILALFVWLATIINGIVNMIF